MEEVRTLRTKISLAAAFLLCIAGATPAMADPVCDDPVAEAIHEAHEAGGDAGEPLHEVEGAYCDLVH
jgi:hypothetical protein